MEGFVKRGDQSSERNLLKSLLDKADWLARNGRFDKSFSTFSNAFRLGLVPKERISSLVKALLDFERKRLCIEEQKQAFGRDEDIFACSLCKCLLVEPVTLACGHTFCKTCLSEELALTGRRSCFTCEVPVSENADSINVLVATTIQKWFPSEYERQEKKLNGRRCLMENDPKLAIHCFNTVLSISDDFHSLCWRAEAYLKLGQLHSALQDIEQACKVRPHLARIYHKKSQVLAKFAHCEGILSPKHEESVLALLRCCSLAPKCERYRRELTGSLYELLSPKFTSLERNTAVLKLLNINTNVEEVETIAKSVNKNRLAVDKQGNREDAKLNQNWFRGSAKRTLQSPSYSYHGNGERPSKRDSGKEGQLLREKKRLRCGSPVLTQNTFKTTRATEVKGDFDCNLCYSLLYEPVTTTCGHTFCRECLKRSLDHRVECPCCRTPLVQYYSGHVKMEITQVLEAILSQYFTAEYNERKRKSEEEIEKLRSSWKDQSPEIPIFVCTMAFPKVQCPLHVFEPRYRLMLRRCIESGSRCFGMCPRGNDPDKNFADYGTMLEVKTVDFLPDGRSIVHTMGAQRFSVVSRSLHDGYDVAKIEWLEDEHISDSEELRELAQLSRVGYITMRRWFSQMTQEQQQCVVNAVGPVPVLPRDFQWAADGPDWLWWTLAALPLQDKPKLIILGMTSLLERLKSVIRFLQLMLTLQKTSSEHSSN